VKNLITFSILLLSLYSINAQNYFGATRQDSVRWIGYANLLNDSSIKSMVKADSCYNFALKEYEFGQYDKTRSLCEIATQYAPHRAEPHILTGKAFVSGGKFCYPADVSKKYIKGEEIWPAIDEWEVALQKGDESGQAKKLIEVYSKYMPEKTSFEFCFGESSLTEESDFFVNCWIQRKTKIRFRAE
jgi:hypothetical protein